MAKWMQCLLLLCVAASTTCLVLLVFQPDLIQRPQVGRYQPAGSGMICDTKTGDIYSVVKTQYPNGTGGNIQWGLYASGGLKESQ